MPLDTPVPERFQEQLEQTVRDVLAGISQSTVAVRRELPPPRAEETLDLACAPELDALTVAAVPGERTLEVTLYFGAVPDGAVPVVPGAADAPVADRWARDSGEPPTHLGDLGGGYADLSAAVVETLAAYCDAPAPTVRRAYPEADADLVCTGWRDDALAFSLRVPYPEHVETVYGDGRRDLARRFGLPY